MKAQLIAIVSWNSESKHDLCHRVLQNSSAGVSCAARMFRRGSANKTAQIHAAAEKGWLDLKRCRDESLIAIRRAGADMILTYFARAFAEDQSKVF